MILCKVRIINKIVESHSFISSLVFFEARFSVWRKFKVVLVSFFFLRRLDVSLFDQTLAAPMSTWDLTL